MVFFLAKEKKMKSTQRAISYVFCGAVIWNLILNDIILSAILLKKFLHN